MPIYEALARPNQLMWVQTYDVIFAGIVQV